MYVIDDIMSSQDDILLQDQVLSIFVVEQLSPTPDPVEREERNCDDREEANSKSHGRCYMRWCARISSSDCLTSLIGLGQVDPPRVSMLRYCVVGRG